MQQYTKTEFYLRFALNQVKYLQGIRKRERGREKERERESQTKYCKLYILWIRKLNEYNYIGFQKYTEFKNKYI